MGNRLAVTSGESPYAMVQANIEAFKKEIADAAVECFAVEDGDGRRMQQLGERLCVLNELEYCFRMNGWDREPETRMAAPTKRRR